MKKVINCIVILFMLIQVNTSFISLPVLASDDEVTPVAAEETLDSTVSGGEENKESSLSEDQDANENTTLEESEEETDNTETEEEIEETDTEENTETEIEEEIENTVTEEETEDIDTEEEIADTDTEEKIKDTDTEIVKQAEDTEPVAPPPEIEESLITFATSLTGSHLFVTTRRTTGTDEQIMIPTANSTPQYDFDIDWGDSTIEHYGPHSNPNPTHKYANPDEYIVSISGTFPRFYMNNNATYRDKLIAVNQWGNSVWTTMEGAFRGCINVQILATDTPDLSTVTDMRNMFLGATNVTGNFSSWDTSKVTTMNAMFYEATNFDQDLSSWNVAQVTDFTNFLGINTAIHPKLSTFNYNQLLSNRSLQNVQASKTLGGGRSTYGGCEPNAQEGINGHVSLDIDKSRTLIDGSRESGCPTDNTRPFLTTWKTTVVDEEIIIGTAQTAGVNYDFEIDWGDGSLVQSYTGAAPVLRHTYSVPDIYTISIKGIFPRIYLNNSSAAPKLLSIDQWGDNLWTHMYHAFQGATNVEILANDAPRFANMSLDFEYAFAGASSLNQDLSSWDTSNVTKMNGMFYNATSFNGSLSGWDTSKVTTMNSMFRGATNFNQPLDHFKMNNVTDVLNMFRDAISFNGTVSGWTFDKPVGFGNNHDWQGMFRDASSFNQDVSSWNTSNVTNMSAMFNGATSFNQDLSAWDTSNVIDMSVMFYNASNFNGSLSGWDTNKVTTMNAMFRGATNFNQPLDHFKMNNVIDVLNMFRGAVSFNSTVSGWTFDKPVIFGTNHDWQGMFRDASSFNQDVSSWDTSNVTNMSAMFNGATSFNQDLSAWDTSNVTDMSVMFYNATSFNGSLGGWDTSKVITMNSMFRYATNFNQDISNRNVSAVTNADYMFNGATAFSVYNYNALLDTWSKLDLNAASFTNNTPKYGGCEVNNQLGIDGRARMVVAGWNVSLGLLNCPIKGAVSYDPPAATYVSGSVLATMTTSGDLVAVPAGWTSINNRQYTKEYAQNAKESIILVDDGGTGMALLEISWIDQSTGTGSLPGAMISTWRTTAYQEEIELGTYAGTYDIMIDWGDGTVENYSEAAPILKHKYMFPRTGQIQIIGDFPGIKMKNAVHAAKLLSIDQWGDNEWTSMAGAFQNAKYFHIFAENTPKFADVPLDFSYAFAGASVFNESLSGRDTSNVTNMRAMFNNATSFNQPLESWDVRQVTTMRDMFAGASAFNQDLNNRETESLEDLRATFYNANKFNGNLSGWDTSKVMDMTAMFQYASSFNQDLSFFDTSSLTGPAIVPYEERGARSMFYDARAFSTYNYNALLDSWSKQPKNSIVFNNTFAKYGGCEWNYWEGVDGYNRLIDKGWNVTNGGFDPCTTKGTVAYVPDDSNPRYESVLATITTSGTLVAVPAGWTSIGNHQYTKLYTSNLREIIEVEDEYGTGLIPVGVTWISDDSDHSAEPFTTVWRTTFLDETIKIGTMGTGYDFQIDWGDGSAIASYTGTAPLLEHVYAEPGAYTVKIFGYFPRIYMQSVPLNSKKLIEVQQWGNIRWSSMQGAFYGAINLNVSALDAPKFPIGAAISMYGMFNGATNIRGNFSHRDVSQVTTMHDMFVNTSFDYDISAWNVSSLTDATNMFYQNPPRPTLSIEHYNALLDKRSFQNVKSLTFIATNAKYGGCNDNAQLGIDGHIRLASKGWNIGDGGIVGCELEGTMFYRPSEEMGTTGGPVVAVLRTNVPIQGIPGWNCSMGVNTCTKSYTANTTEEINFTGLYLSDTGTALVDITWIDDTKPSGILSYVSETTTNHDVEVTLTLNTTGTLTSTGWTDSGDEHTFTKVYTDNTTGDKVDFSADTSGYTGYSLVYIDWIDRDAPVGTVHYLPQIITSQDVIATVSFNEPDVIVTNNGGNTSYLFTGNGSFTFEFQDAAGNTGTAVADVTWIDRSPIVPTIVYSPDDSALTDQLVTATISFNKSGVVVTNNGGFKSYTFPNSCWLSCSFTFEYVDLAGTTGNATATVNWYERWLNFKPFKMTRETTTDDESITIPTYTSNAPQYDFVVDWGDGIREYFTGSNPNPTHTYALTGEHDVQIRGIFPRILFNNGTQHDKILSVDQWGEVEWYTMDSAFAGCTNLQILATDTPNMNKVTNMSHVFYKATNLTGNFSGWNTSNVTTMQGLFREATNFNQDISSWDTSKVTDMYLMFHYASGFNQPLGAWNTSSVVRMQDMFNRATSFNQDLSSWDTSNVTNMQGMFYLASNFNGSLSGRDTSKVTNMYAMFYNATSFNQDLSSRNVKNVTTMQQMFEGATAFNGSLSGRYWEVPNVNLSYMFRYASGFNQPLNSWNTSGVVNMQEMFNRASSFNQDLSSWDTSQVTTMYAMFYLASSFNGSLSGRDTSKVTNMYVMFYNATSFNQDLSSRNVKNVTTMQQMFEGATAFNGSLSGRYWEVPNVNLAYMFRYATNFNQPLNSWNTSEVINMQEMFNRATSFNQDLDSWDTSKVTNMYAMFYEDKAFNGNLSGRDTSKVTNMSLMFYNATGFDQDLSSRNIEGISATNNMANMLYNVKLSTYNYNALLGSRSKQNVLSGITNFPVSSTYGGEKCVSNALEGIAGRELLTKSITQGGKGWSITDNGLDRRCEIVRPFITTWETTTADESIQIPTYNYGNIPYDFDVDWGDGTTGSYIGSSLSVTHTYENRGTHTIKIYGAFPRIYLQNDSSNAEKLRSIDQRGDIEWKSMEYAFGYAKNLNIKATDTPNLSNVTNMNYMFYYATNLTGSFSGWDTSKVTNMAGIFYNATNFNQDLSSWDTSKVTSMSSMFSSATNFNQPLSGWDTSKVTSMSSMFSSATNFNQDLSSWDTSKVTSMSSMFRGATNFNQPLNNWNTSNVTNMYYMFYSATNFNQPLNNWDTSKVTNMYYMFYNATSFNQDLSSWDTSNVTDMQYMFYNTTSFNGSLSGRNTSKVQNMSYMFYNATNFNSPLYGWDLGKTTNVSYMFYNANAFNQDLSSWNLSGATNLAYMFYYARKFNGSLSGRDTSKVTNMSHMFYNATGFDQDLSSRNIEGISSTSNMANMFYNVSLSTYNYNAILDSRSKQSVRSDITNFTILSSYGGEGCVSNAAEGIAGRATLVAKGWSISDAGLERRCTDMNLRPFITTWETVNTNDTITIPIYNSSTVLYNFDIDWGDGTTGSYKGSLSSVTHTYKNKGTYTIQIKGVFPRIYLYNNSSNARKLRSIDQWGDIEWQSMEYAFYYTTGLNIKATDTPDLNQVTSMYRMFSETTNLTGNFSGWDTSKVQNMSYMFSSATNFNSPLYGWDLGKTTNVSYMFQYANTFNQDLSSWNLSGATSLSNMFYYAANFNQDLSSWDTHTVTNMSYMFSNARNFDQDLSNWNLSGATNLAYMFYNATSFNQDLSSWDVHTVTNMSYMFSNATNFNQDLSSWNLSGATNLAYMFNNATSFNQDLSSWDVHTVINMSYMFQNARLSTYNYNALLDSRSKQNVPSTITNFVVSSSYGGACAGVSNAAEGIVGHDALVAKGWSIFDAGLEDRRCTATNLRPFITTWKTVSTNDTIIIPTQGANYNFDVDWGDGTTGSYIGYAPTVTHTYGRVGTYTIQIKGVFPRIYLMNNSSNAVKLRSIDQWGDIEWTSMDGAFGYATGLNIKATDTPDLSKVTSMYHMFYYTTNLTGNFSGWDTSKVENMSYMFYNATNFDQDLSSRDTSKVTNMYYMFYNASGFNQDLSSRNVEGISSSSNMQRMFQNAGLSTYNYNAILDSRSKQNVRSDITNFVVSSSYGGACRGVSNAAEGIAGRAALVAKGWSIVDNGDSCTEPEEGTMRPFIMTYTFKEYPELYISFSSPNGLNKVDIDWGDGTTGSILDSYTYHSYNVTGDYQIKISGNFSQMRMEMMGGYGNKISVDQWGDIQWTNMDYMFGWGEAESINIKATDIPQFTGSNVSLYNMFGYTRNLTGNFSNWDTSNVTDMSHLFSNAENFNADISSWDTSNVQNMSYMFSNASSFDQDLSSRNIEGISSSYSMENMFQNAGLSTYNYNAILDSRSKQNVPYTIRNLVVSSSYGGACAGVSNAVEGIAGHDALVAKGWYIVDDGLAQCVENNYDNFTPFITTWETTTADESIRIPTYNSSSIQYDFDIDWGDGTVQHYKKSSFNGASHTYATPGEHQVKIYGVFPRMYGNSNYLPKLRSIDQWGDIQWTSMEYAFTSAANLNIKATDTPDLSKVQNMSYMFSSTINLTGNFSGWNTSKVQNMSYMFNNAENFDQDLSSRNVEGISSSSNMQNIFQNAGLSTYNYNAILDSRSKQNVRSDITNFAVSSTYGGACAGVSNAAEGIAGHAALVAKGWTIIDSGEEGCVNFDGFKPFVMTWKTTTSREMIQLPLYNNTSVYYNFDIDWGDGTAVKHYQGYFATISHTYVIPGEHQIKIYGIFPRIYLGNNSLNAVKLRSIDQWGDIEWTSMEQSFMYATNLNIKATDTPDLSNVTSMYYMFYNATNLTGNFSGRNTSNVTNMSYMFYNATNFNSPLYGWNLGKITNVSYMFSSANAFNQDLSSWNLSGATSLAYMFQNASAFNQDLSSRDVHTVTNMSYMFNNAESFDQDLSSRNIEGISSSSNMQNMLQNTKLSIYNYNAILDSRSKQDVKTSMNFNSLPAQYGGCAANRLEGIEGYERLRQDKLRVITDNGLAPCIASATLHYSTTALTNQDVIVTLTLNDVGYVISSGREGTGKIFTKIYSENITGEIIEFGVANATGNVQVDITRIDKSLLPTGGGGGGGGTIKHQDNCPNGDFSPSYYDGECGDSVIASGTEGNEAIQNNEHNVADESGLPRPSDSQGPYGVYERAKEYHLTSAETYEAFRPTDHITRAEMAKIITSYMQSSLRSLVSSGRTASITNDEAIQISSGLSHFTSFRSQGQNRESCSSFNDLNTVNPELQSYVIQACDLGLMGYYSDGETIKESFLPNDNITRAEVATTISRMLRGNKYQGTEQQRYQNHLLALREEDIIQKDLDPMTLEIRMNVYLMLSRIPH